jgi:hypothetical protein
MLEDSSRSMPGERNQDLLIASIALFDDVDLHVLVARSSLDR